MARRYRAVFFDFGGTLFSYRNVARQTGPIVREAARRLGAEGRGPELGEAWWGASAQAFRRFAHEPFYLHRDLFHETFREFGRRPASSNTGISGTLRDTG